MIDGFNVAFSSTRLCLVPGSLPIMLIVLHALWVNESRDLALCSPDSQEAALARLVRFPYPILLIHYHSASAAC